MSNDFAAMLQEAAGMGQGRTGTRLRPGQAVTGTVVQVGHDSVFIDIGMTTEGRIDRRELEDAEGQLKVQPGDTLKASVVSVDDVTGPRLTVAFGKGRGKLDEGALEAARDARLPVEGVVGAAVKGGVEVKVLGARAFCPASQLGTEFIADLASLEGQTLEFLVTEVKNGGRDVIVSRKALLLEGQKQKAEATLSQLQVGNDYPAKVVSIQKYGAFVDLGGGVEGLLHISELAHGRVERVEDILNVGEEITVRLLGITPGEKGAAPKLRLSLRARTEAETSAEPETGEVLEGVVSKVSSYGVFVDTAKGTGLVPSRELGTPRNSDARRTFPIGKPVSVVLMSKDPSRGITFSIARVAKVEERQNYREFAKTQRAQPGEASNMGSFGALLQKELNLPEPAPAQKAAAPAQAPAPTPAPPQKAPTAAAARGAVTPPGAPGEPAKREPAAPHQPPGRAPKAVLSGPPPTDRTRVDTTPPAAEAPAKPSRGPDARGPDPRGPDARGRDLGVVRGRRRPPQG